jgi:hypothetical protein
VVTEQVIELDAAGRHIVRHEMFETGQLREAVSVLDDLYAVTLDAEDALAWEVHRGVIPRDTPPESWWMTRRVLGLRRGVVYTWSDLHAPRDAGPRSEHALHVAVVREGVLASVDRYGLEDRATADARFAELAVDDRSGGRAEPEHAPPV